MLGDLFDGQYRLLQMTAYVIDDGSDDVLLARLAARLLVAFLERDHLVLQPGVHLVQVGEAIQLSRYAVEVLQRAGPQKYFFMP